MLPGRILACTDFSANGDEAVAYAATLARALGAELIVAHLCNGHVMLQRELWRAPSAAEVETRHAAALAKLRELARNLGVNAARCLCADGDPRAGIPELAAREGADLVVLGRYGHSGVARLFLGSVADAVVRNATVPVLAVGNGHGARVAASPRPTAGA